MTAEEALAFARETLAEFKGELRYRHGGDWNEVGTLKITVAGTFIALAREMREAGLE